MFRSVDVDLYQIKTSLESIWDVLNFIGSANLTMIDSKPEDEPYLDTDFGSKIKRLEDWKMRLEAIFERNEEYNMKGRVEIKNYSHVGKCMTRRAEISNDLEKRLLEKYYAEAEERLNGLDSLINNYENIVSRIDELNNAVLILENIKEILPAGFGASQYIDAFDNAGSNLAKSELVYFAGIVNSSELLRFKRIVFRISRGNIIVKSKELLTNNSFQDKRIFSDNSEKKVSTAKSIIFMVCYGNALVPKIRNLILAFNVFCLRIPSSQVELTGSLSIYKNDLKENWKICLDTYDHIRETIRYFLSVSPDTTCSKIDELLYMIEKEKKIFELISTMRHTGNIYSFNVWLDSEKEVEFTNKLAALNSSDPNFVKPQFNKLNFRHEKTTPPTLFKLNDFTAPFQGIVETYGIPKFKEINPAFFTIVTFPYEFGVMFGDFGHGMILFLAGIFLCIKSHSYKKAGGIFGMLASLRYLFVLMGFFAVYNGVIYNDFFSVKMPLFPSCYTMTYNDEMMIDSMKKKDGCTYPFGLDFAWGFASNEVPFFNSFKMKLSIVIGVLHMSLGIFMKGLNSIFFNNYIDFFFEFVPQIVFMLSVFGYMVLLIFVKWARNWDDVCNHVNPDKPCPAIINTFTSLYKVNSEILPDQNLQKIIQLSIIGVALTCVFLMLFPKPIILGLKGPEKKKTKQIRKGSFRSESEFTVETEEPLLFEDSGTQTLHLKKKGGHSHDEEHGEGFGELIIHQLIETIEFVLGSISNTASYLRLWALSLAHAQLAKVFLELIMANFYIKPSNGIIAGIALIPTFFGLALVTLSVLMIMDLMECFLHTLRLHWVEFQNKFFKGEGRKFELFNFEAPPMEL